MKTEIGSITHLRRLLRKMEAMCARPRWTEEDKAVMASMIRQEMLRRSVINSDGLIYKRLGLDIPKKEYPSWMKKEET